MIDVRSVSRSYGLVRALDSVSLTIAPGEVVYLKGPSGSGKTTLLRLIAGLDEPDAGRIDLDGETASRPGWRLAPHLRSLGLVFQQQVLWPHLTVAQNVAFPIEDWAGARRRNRLEELLEVTGLSALASRTSAELSGGEARRVAIARALAAEPRRLLLDEPLVHLDAEWRDRITNLLQRQVVGTGVSVLWVTHDEFEAGPPGSRVLTLRAGCLVGRERPQS